MYNIDSRMFIINPDDYFDTVNSLYELRDQVASFNNPLEIKTEEDLKVLDFISKIENQNIEDLNIKKYKLVFSGLFPDQKKQKSYCQKIAKLFNCDEKINNTELSQISVHFVASKDMKYLVDGSKFLLNNFEDLKHSIKYDINSSNLHRILKIFSSIEHNNDILIGWTRYEYI